MALDGWWAQTVTVGWERITGRRLPHQMPDGTFTASVTRTITTDPAALRALLDDEPGALFGAMDVEPRSRPGVRSPRFGHESGTIQVTVEPIAEDRARVNVSHSKLGRTDDVAVWKAFWAGWLADLDEG